MLIEVQDMKVAVVDSMDGISIRQRLCEWAAKATRMVFKGLGIDHWLPFPTYFISSTDTPPLPQKGTPLSWRKKKKHTHSFGGPYATLIVYWLFSARRNIIRAIN